MTMTTFGGILRAQGGGDARLAYCGSALLVADFFVSATAAAASTLVQRSSTDTRSVVLPPGAVVVEVQINGASTGGTSPTFDLGTRTLAGGVNTQASLLNEAASNAKGAFTFAAAQAGASLGVALASTDNHALIGGAGASAPTGGSVSGRVLYYVPTDGAIRQ